MRLEYRVDSPVFSDGAMSRDDPTSPVATTRQACRQDDPVATTRQALSTTRPLSQTLSKRRHVPFSLYNQSNRVSAMQPKEH